MSRLLARTGVTLVLMAGVMAPAATIAASPPGAITWTVDHARKTISAKVLIQIYTGCSGNPAGEAAERASACRLPTSMTGAATQFMADKIKRQIERIWNKPYKYRCYTLNFSVDVKLGSDRAHLDADRIGVRLDPSPGDVRNFVMPERLDRTRWNSDDPADRVIPTNDGAHETTWSEATALTGMNTYAHEFGHLLGLHDGYHDVVNPETGVVESVPYPDAPHDLMSTQAGVISQATIDRLVRRNLPNMRDTSGNAVRDDDLACDYRGEWAGRRLMGFLRYCANSENPYWGAEVQATNGDRGWISYLIEEGSNSAPASLDVPFVEPELDALIRGTGTFVPPTEPGGAAHFVVVNAEGTYDITLEQGKFCTTLG